MDNINLDAKLKRAVTKHVGAAQNMVVDCDEARAKAHDIANALNDKKKDIVEWFEPLRIKAHEAYQGVLDKKREALEPINQALPIIKDKIIKYDKEQARIREEAERAAREEAERKAAEERARLEKEAAAAKKRGDTEEAERAAMEAEQTTAESQMAVAAAPAAKPKGSVENWQARVIDLPKLIRAAAADPQYFGAVCADEKWLRQFAKSTKGRFNIPGVIFEDVGTLRLS